MVRYNKGAVLDPGLPFLPEIGENLVFAGAELFDSPVEILDESVGHKPGKLLAVKVDLIGQFHAQEPIGERNIGENLVTGVVQHEIDPSFHGLVGFWLLDELHELPQGGAVVGKDVGTQALGLVGVGAVKGNGLVCDVVLVNGGHHREINLVPPEAKLRE